MNNQIGIYIDTLKKFGIEREEAEIYLHLLSNGQKTMSELRKDSRLGLSKVRTILARLKKHGLIAEIRNENGRYIKVSSLSRFKELLNRKKEDVLDIKTKFENVYDRLLEISYGESKQSKILHYSGIEGLKQVMWNTADAVNVLRLMELPEMSDYLDFGFYEKIREKFVKNKISYLELTNEMDMKGWTNNVDFIKNWKPRYISQDILDIKFETMIYNDVVAIYNIQEGQIFCVEIHNAKLARMQKQLFDFIFKRSLPMKVIDLEHGHAVISNF